MKPILYLLKSLKCTHTLPEAFKRDVPRLTMTGHHSISETSHGRARARCSLSSFSHKNELKPTPRIILNLSPAKQQSGG